MTQRETDRAPEVDYAALMKADVLFIEAIRVAFACGDETPQPWPAYVAPEIPRREDFIFPPLDNGPGREKFSVDIVDHERIEAIEVSVKTSEAEIEGAYQHSPFNRPQRGRFTILDLASESCRYPTDTG